MLTLATARTGEYGGDSPLGRTLSAIIRDAAVTQIEIDGLDLSETAALVADRAGRPALAHADLEALVRRTSGNPFFVESLIDAGLTEPGAVFPRGLAELLVSRVQALGPQVAAALEAAAVVGREFDAGLVAGIAGIELDEAGAALDRAVDAQLIAMVADRPGRMGFAHDLVHEALTVKLGPGRSATLHARVVDVLEPRAEDGADDALAAAAGHAIAALPAIAVERAGALAERAGSRLVASRAPADAAQLLTGALTACEDAGAPLALRVRLRLALGDALRAAGSEEAAATFESALSLARRTRDAALVARAALGAVGPVVTIAAVDRGRVAILEEALDALDGEESAVGAQAQARLAVELAYDADTDRRDSLSATALSTARAHSDPRTLAAALGARHVVLWGPDHTRERLPLADEMLALARRADDPALELQARTWRIVDLEELGDGAALEAELEAYAATAARVSQSPYAWYVPAWQSTRAFLAGRPARARELQRQAIRLGRQVGDGNVQFVQRLQFIVALADERAHDIDLLWQTGRVRKSPVGWAYRALSTWALAAAGQEEEARRELQAQRRAGAPSSWPRDTNWLSAAKELSEAACLLDDLEVGAELEELLEPFADRIVVSARALMCMGSVCGALGRLAALRGDLDRAVERYEQAIERASAPRRSSGRCTTVCDLAKRCWPAGRPRKRRGCWTRWPPGRRTWAWPASPSAPAVPPSARDFVRDRQATMQHRTGGQMGCRGAPISTARSRLHLLPTCLGEAGAVSCRARHAQADVQLVVEVALPPDEDQRRGRRLDRRLLRPRAEVRIQSVGQVHYCVLEPISPSPLSRRPVASGPWVSKRLSSRPSVLGVPIALTMSPGRSTVSDGG
jgi:hypothetical protein